MTETKSEKRWHPLLVGMYGNAVGAFLAWVLQDTLWFLIMAAVCVGCGVAWALLCPDCTD